VAIAAAAVLGLRRRTCWPRVLVVLWRSQLGPVAPKGLHQLPPKPLWGPQGELCVPLWLDEVLL
jgi:hypothetical protein